MTVNGDFRTRWMRMARVFFWKIKQLQIRKMKQLQSNSVNIDRVRHNAPIKNQYQPVFASEIPEISPQKNHLTLPVTFGEWIIHLSIFLIIHVICDVTSGWSERCLHGKFIARYDSFGFSDRSETFYNFVRSKKIPKLSRFKWMNNKALDR